MTVSLRMADARSEALRQNACKRSNLQQSHSIFRSALILLVLPQEAISSGELPSRCRSPKSKYRSIRKAVSLPGWALRIHFPETSLQLAGKAVNKLFSVGDDKDVVH